MGEYRIFDGEEFYSEGVVFSSKEDAERLVNWWERMLNRFFPDFRFKYRIVKVKSGYKVYTNNTVRNMINY